MDVQATSATTLGPSYQTVFKSLSDELKECIQNCTQCAQVCEQMIQHCLEQGGKHAEPNHIRLLQDCVEICKTSMAFMVRESDYHGQTCGVCADICTACADDCDTMGDDEMMKACADVCRRCADSCERMSVRH